jgi:hypothetical protein
LKQRLSQSTNAPLSSGTNAPLSSGTVLSHCKNKALKKPDIFYHVKITHVSDDTHLSPTSGGLQPDLNGRNDIMALLWEKPMLPSDVLQPLLSKYLPFYKATDA